MSSRMVAWTLALGLLVAVIVAAAARSETPAQLVRAFNCIHRYEGAWTANTGNGYQGGLQMSAQFQRTYGAEYVRLFGGAHNWPPSLQIAVAIRAYAHEGFGPWPNTRRVCGL
jgi:hypothetical protein